MNVLLNLLASSKITLDAPTIIAILVGCVLLSLCFTIPFSKKTTASALRLATDLKERYESISPVEGRSLAEIEEVCGAGRKRNATSDGCRLYLWITVGFEFTLKFDRDGVCVGIVEIKDRTHMIK